jgi:DNA replication and repair protein RecF
LWVRRLELLDFRSYLRAELDLAPGVSVLVGPNGRGKTNILEALHRVAVGSSHRIAGDGALVRDGRSEAIVRASIVGDDGQQRQVDIRLGAGRTQAKVDGQPVRRSADACGVLRIIAFAPEDLAIVRGDPADRRQYLDQLLTQRRASYGAALLEYERVLRQRNTLLRDQRGGAHDADVLAAWTDQLVAHGAPLIAARLAALAALRAPVAEAHRRLTGSAVPLTLAYRSEALTPMAPGADSAAGSGAEVDVEAVATSMRQALREAAAEESRRGLTLIGPHRDELLIALDGLPARTTASQGEAWSIALACKIGATPLLTEVGDRPVLLLDDVFSELDDTRRARVVELCAAFDQVLVTAAVDADVPLVGPRIDVRREDDGAGSTLHVRTSPVTGTGDGSDGAAEASSQDLGQDLGGSGA